MEDRGKSACLVKLIDWLKGYHPKTFLFICGNKSFSGGRNNMMYTYHHQTRPISWRYIFIKVFFNKTDVQSRGGKKLDTRYGDEILVVLFSHLNKSRPKG